VIEIFNGYFIAKSLQSFSVKELTVKICHSQYFMKL